MMLRLIPLFLSMTAVACFTSVRAQITVQRFIQFDADSDSSRESGFLTRSKVALEALRAVNSVTPPPSTSDEAELSEYPNRDQAWSLKSAELFDLFRWSSGRVLSLRCYQELTANARNDLGFNPRAMYWEEELGLFNFASIASTNSSLTVFHRCKHDIDNSDSEVSDQPSPVSIQKRTIILGGASLRQTLEPNTLFAGNSAWTLQSELTIEGYFYAYDYHYPALFFSRSWTELQWCVRGVGRLGYHVLPWMELATRLYISQASFSATASRPSAFGTTTRAELQCVLYGSESSFTLALLNERLFDDVARISGDATNTWSIGLRFAPHGAW